MLMLLFSHESSQGVLNRCDFASLALNTTFRFTDVLDFSIFLGKCHIQASSTYMQVLFFFNVFFGLGLKSQILVFKNDLVHIRPQAVKCTAKQEEAV